MAEIAGGNERLQQHVGMLEINVGANARGFIWTVLTTLTGNVRFVTKAATFSQEVSLVVVYNKAE